MKSYATDNSILTPPGSGGELAELLRGVAYTVVRGSRGGNCARTVISSIHNDSREVQPGGLFVAVAGTVTDGHLFIGDALQRDCAVVVVEAGHDWNTVPEEWEGCIVEVEDSRKAYATVAENYFGHPASGLTLIGITGTNGKTTITYLLEEVLGKLGFRVGVIGTVNYRYDSEHGKVILPSPFTTPEARQLQALLFEMAQAGVQYVIMEVSSHALSQVRIGNLHFDVAAFTNLSHDHLDYHQTMEDYFQVKTKLFTEHLKYESTAVVALPMRPADALDWSGQLVAICRKQKISFLCCGSDETADVRLLDYESTLSSTDVSVQTPEGKIVLSTPLVGHFNVDNLLTALGVTVALGLAPRATAPLLAASNGAPGRLERVTVNDGTDFGKPVVLVDYAHTPDALQQVLATVAALPHRDLYCVFGCGGDRDKTKRPLMGEFAGRYADVVVVTDDNPRTEDPAAILDQIRPGVEKNGMVRRDTSWLCERHAGEKGYVVIADRGKAIESAILAAGEADIVLIAGKGHEKYQLSLAGKRFFDDCLEAQCALTAWNPQAVLRATGGSICGGTAGESPLRTVSTDSRTIGRNDVFVALVGEKFDGHDFLDEVSRKGAGCLVVNRPVQLDGEQSPMQVKVPDTLSALGNLAHFRRCLMSGLRSPCIIGITGSCGKTTVKEMVSAILLRKWPAGPDYPPDCVLKTHGNLNNLIGLPLSLLPITPRHRAAVLEMGMNAFGEIARMARIADPNISCITNVHGVHLEGLQTVAGVARAKEELFAATRQDGMLVVNLDDERVKELASHYTQKKVTFSARPGNYHLGPDLWVSDVEVIAEGVITFSLHSGDELVDVHLYTVGLHNVTNAVTAAAISSAAGATLAEIAAGLADFRPADRRMVMLETKHGVGILNDTYNANPASMTAGLQTLVQLGKKRGAAVLGDMLELGEASRDAHYELGRLASQLQVRYLAVVGAYATVVAKGAVSGGMVEDRVRVFPDKDAAAKWIEELQESGALKKGDWVLVKASRGLQMETIVARLTGKG